MKKKKKKKNILAILPVSIGGRLTTSSIIDGYRQNNCNVTVYDELFDHNLEQVLENEYSQILGYDFSGLKIKIDNKLTITWKLIQFNLLFLLSNFIELDSVGR